MKRLLVVSAIALGLAVAPITVTPVRVVDAAQHAGMTVYGLTLLIKEKVAEAGKSGGGKGKGCGPGHSPPPRGGGGSPPDGGIYCKPDKSLKVVRTYEAYGCTWYVHVLRSNPKGQKYTFPFKLARL